MSIIYLQTVYDLRDLMDGKAVKEIKGNRSVHMVRAGIDKLVSKMNDPYSIFPCMPRSVYGLNDMRTQRVRVLALLMEVERKLIYLQKSPKRVR